MDLHAGQEQLCFLKNENVQAIRSVESVLSAQYGGSEIERPHADSRPALAGKSRKPPGPAQKKSQTLRATDASDNIFQREKFWIR